MTLPTTLIEQLNISKYFLRQKKQTTQKNLKQKNCLKLAYF